MLDPIISLTTIPTRIAHIQPCIDSLLTQGLPVYLWIPEEVIRIKAVTTAIPGFLRNRPNLTVTIVPDRGPITKLLPALEAGHEMIITADDDHAYGTHWATGLLEQAEKRPDAAICYRGRVFGKGRRYRQSKVISGELRQVDLITGVKGALYRARFFDAGIFEEWRGWPMNDDIVICTHLKRRTVPILAVPLPQGCRLVPQDYMHTDALYEANTKRGLNDQGLKQVFWQ